MTQILYASSTDECLLEKLLRSPGAEQKFSTRQIENDFDVVSRLTKKLRNFADVCKPLDTAHQSASSFCSELIKTWYEHNNYCDEIDGLLLIHESHPQPIQNLLRAYSKMKKLDERKRSLSVSIKSVIDRSLGFLDGKLLPDEFFLAQTPAHRSFWELYAPDHSEPGAVDKYHRGSEAIMNYRISNDPLLRGINRTKPRSFEREKTEFMLRSRYSRLLETMDLLLFIDNYCEPVWIKSMVGIPDYYLRAEISRLVSDEQIDPFNSEEIEKVAEKHLHAA